ncbi:hypothetical protein [Actinocorallia sp. A-T 12471]|uniref:hypothetical protein n=1 Tax=Actinocorallia sp. A-T 12471 TaxID=3089813 RepID=UPI0029D159E9|nr:hypothetical protein [Actinocorallia sp. A-T 12471]MDX6744688.1 hypothetical protein [Actinocorallia sp. A-T 12471]
MVERDVVFLKERAQEVVGLAGVGVRKIRGYSSCESAEPTSYVEVRLAEGAGDVVGVAGKDGWYRPERLPAFEGLEESDLPVLAKRFDGEWTVLVWREDRRGVFRFDLLER